MRRLLWLFLGTGLAVALTASVVATKPARRPAPPPRLALPLAWHYGQLPLYFEPNQGQSASEVRFLARAAGLTMFVTGDESVLVLRRPGRGTVRQSVVRMRLEGGETARSVDGLEPLPGISNYFVGNDPAKWRTGIPHYARVEARQIYPGIDLVFYGNQRRIEYDFVVEPGADPGRIALAWQGVDALRVNEAGDLVLETGVGELVQRRPVVYQQVGGRRVEVEARYRVNGRRVSFELARYQPSERLIIDPVLVYSTYLGGTGADQGLGIAADASGSAYVTGETQSVDFPVQNAAFGVEAGSSDAFVTKFGPGGGVLAYSTYLGGSGFDIGTAIAVDANGSAYVTGYTNSPNFPQIFPFQGRQTGYDAFVVKLSPAGSTLAYSTYLGGSDDDFGLGIAVDANGSAYVTGYTQSTNFPLMNQYQTKQPAADAFVTKLSPAGNTAIYSTYLGGSDADFGQAIAVDANGSAYVTGYTLSTNFPLMNPYQAHQSSADAFVTKLAPAGNALVYSTYLGGGDFDAATGIAVDGSGSAYVAGYTLSTNFPTMNPLQASQGGGTDGFVTKLSGAGNVLVYSTYYGGSAADTIQGIAVDTGGSAYITGSTLSANLPMQNPIQQKRGGKDAFIAKLAPAGNAVLDSTYLGGDGDDGGAAIAVDKNGAAYVTGFTLSANFPLQNPSQSHQVLSDAFVVKLGTSGLTGTTVTTNPSGLQVIVDGVTCTAPCAVNWAAGSSHTLATTSPQGSGNAVYTFTSWSNGGPQSQTVTASGVAATYTANFSAQFFVDVLARSGGSVSPASGYYTQGQQFTIGATPSSGFTFVGWSGSGSGSYSGPNSSAAITVNGPITETAVFAPLSCLGAYSLSPTLASFNAGGGNGSVMMSAGLNCPWAAAPVVSWITVTSGATGTGNGTIAYTVAPNTSGARTGTIVSAGQVLTVTQSGQAGTTSQFIQRLYLDFLFRPAEPAGLSYWVNQIDSGQQSRAQAALAFISGQEFADTGLYVTDLYTAALNRDPDYPGWASWLTQIRAGLPRLSVVAAFLGSSEFQSVYGSNLNNTQFVQLVYQNVLGRQPDTNGFIYWVNQLNIGVARAQVMEAFFTSTEYALRVHNRQLTNMAYLGFFARTPDPGGRSYWTSQLDAGLSPVDFVNLFISNAEFINRLGS